MICVSKCVFLPAALHKSFKRKPVCRFAAVQGQLRPLGPQVLQLLGLLPGATLPQSMYAPAAYLLDMLQSSLAAAQARARRPAFLNSAPSQDTSPGTDRKEKKSLRHEAFQPCHGTIE